MNELNVVIIGLFSAADPQQGTVEADRDPFSPGEHVQRHSVPQRHRAVQRRVLRLPAVHRHADRQQHAVGDPAPVQDVAAVRHDGHSGHCVVGFRGVWIRRRGGDDPAVSRLAPRLRSASSCFFVACMFRTRCEWTPFVNIWHHLLLEIYRVVQKNGYPFYFWDNFGNSAPILTILTLLQPEMYGS